MELFSVACITCRAKIKVRSMSAIGQVLACPRCGGMVEISPPMGWKPPAGKPEPEAKPQARPTTTDRLEPPVPAAAVTPTEGYVGIAEPVLDDDPLAEAMRLSAERERSQRKLLLVGGACAGAALLVLGLWFGFRKPTEEPTASNTKAPEVAPPAPLPSPTPKVIPTATAAAISSPPAPVPSASLPVPTPTSSAPVVPVPSATSPPPPVPLATPTATPSATALARIDPPSKIPPLPVPSATPIAKGTKPLVAVPLPETEARLAMKAPVIDLSGTTRKNALDVVGRLAGVGIRYDWDTLAPASLKLSEQVTLKLRDVSYAEALKKILEPVHGTYQVVGSNVSVRPLSNGARPNDLRYPLGVLTAGDAGQTEKLLTLVRAFVEPSVWDSSGGTGTLKVEADQLVATGSTDVQAALMPGELTLFLDRLTTACGKRPTGSPPSLESRAAQAKKTLDKLVTMNFRPGVPLAGVLAHLEKSADVIITVDFIALADHGFLPDAKIGIAADKYPLAQVFSALCEPRDWAWRIIDDKTFEITTRESLKRRGYVEFHDLKPLTTAGIAPVVLIEQLKTQFADAGWRETGGEGVLYYDALSGRLLVRQHQDAQLRIERFLSELTAAAIGNASSIGSAVPLGNTVPKATPTGTPAPSNSPPLSAP
ncbi:MAG: hypothetical protein K8U03_13825 [Planctomycetia bacterium]|nr:hypothetical protein [Planctomycetia bacterium]